MQDVEIIGMLRSYVKATLAGVGALKGAACQIQSITESGTTHTITFLWEDNNGTQHTDTLSFESTDKLEELTDIVITSLSDNDLLVYDSATQKWVNSAISVNGVAQSSLDLDVATNLITEDQWTAISALLV